MIYVKRTTYEIFIDLHHNILQHTHYGILCRQRRLQNEVYHELLLVDMLAVDLYNDYDKGNQEQLAAFLTMLNIKIKEGATLELLRTILKQDA